MEYRICWSASSNASFEGATDWEIAEGDPEAELSKGGWGDMPEGLAIALEASGFDWWVETRG